MFERTIIWSSLSKTCSITGWRSGYIIAPAEIVDVAKKVYDFLTVGAETQLHEALRDPSSHQASLFQEK